jgi:hypothetical protein
MRPRFGPGPKTAVIAALVQWLVLHMTFASHVVDGVFPAFPVRRVAFASQIRKDHLKVKGLMEEAGGG